ncbi:MAG TPA: hypothetical protein VJ917_04145 [Saprospiraceae bacterium]|nr:hypothetical protein [Saprospiraceae bacterium]
MNSWWISIIEFLKIILPLVVLYYLLKMVMKRQYQSLVAVLNSKRQENQASFQLQSRLQALERLSLYIERIEFQSLIYRLNEPGMRVGQLYYAMLIALQEELEHNITQQLYVSDQLWQIINSARDHQIRILGELKSELSDDQDARKLMERINAYTAQSQDRVMNTARQAVKEEAKMLL